MRPRITVIGSANVDFIMQAPRLPAVGETITHCQFFQVFGGKGANQAVAAARLGADVTFVAALGNDPYAPIMLEQFRADGLHVEHVAVETDVPSGTALVMFDGQGDNYLTVAPGSNLRVTPDRVRAAEVAIAAADWIVMQMEVPPESVVSALELAAKHRRPVLLNYAPFSPPTFPLSAAIHALVVNETEAAALAGETFSADDHASAGRIAQALRARGGHAAVVLTLGKAGALLATAAGTAHVPGMPVKAVDTTAAGDTFCGALAVALGEGLSLPEAARFAGAAAAISVTRIGAQPSIPTRAETDAFLASI